MNAYYSGLVLTIGAATSVASMLVRLNARSIAWREVGSWGGQVEATPFYAKQLAIVDVSNLFLAFGLVLVASVFISGLFRK